MVPPIPLGTLLRQRYLIQAVLGQGGFGRTYLAIDQERFDERCVLKEFSVPYQDEASVNKSRALFQREASTLYQLQHPQVPRFWAAFEEDQRLFLVQEFADGQTYRQLLNVRKENGGAFSEGEVHYFLSRMLPVLTYIHHNGIIHRDISPENIVLKTQLGEGAQDLDKGLPMLIDFGAVKQATAHLALTSSVTRVGKIGYAPPEQLQTGQVYPNSDLYSLAATCLVLLTGKEPRSLLDSQTLDWRWQIHVSISDAFGAILRRMLSVYPGDRYQSAQAVLDDLQPLLRLPPDQAHTELMQDQTYIPDLYPQSNVSAIPTRSEGDSPSARKASHRRPRSTARSPRGHKVPTLQFPTQKRVRFSMAVAFMLGVAVAGSTLWKVWKEPIKPGGEVWVSGARIPQSEASRIIGYGSANSTVPPSAANPPIATEVPVSTTQPQPIEFPPGKISTILEGNLGENGLQSYLLPASEGQILTTSLSGAGVVMNVLRSTQEGLDAAAYQTRSWTGQLPATDQYLIQISGSGDYKLDVAITPASRPTQEKIERIAFARGSNGTTVTGSISPQQLQRYLFKATQGQLVLVKVLQGTVSFSAIAPNGERIGGTTTQAKDWKGRLPMAGDYVIEVTSAQAEDYALSVEIF